MAPASGPRSPSFAAPSPLGKASAQVGHPLRSSPTPQEEGSSDRTSRLCPALALSCPAPGRSLRGLQLSDKPPEGSGPGTWRAAPAAPSQTSPGKGVRCAPEGQAHLQDRFSAPFPMGRSLEPGLPCSCPRFSGSLVVYDA